jgi:hypothetical protein
MFVASTSVSGISVMVVAVFVACVVEMVEALTEELPRVVLVGIGF